MNSDFPNYCYLCRLCLLEYLNVSNTLSKGAAKWSAGAVPHLQEHGLPKPCLVRRSAGRPDRKKHFLPSSHLRTFWWKQPEEDKLIFLHYRRKRRRSLPGWFWPLGLKKRSELDKASEQNIASARAHDGSSACALLLFQAHSRHDLSNSPQTATFPVPAPALLPHSQPATPAHVPPAFDPAPGLRLPAPDSSNPCLYKPHKGTYSCREEVLRFTTHCISQYIFTCLKM